MFTIHSYIIWLIVICIFIYIASLYIGVSDVVQVSYTENDMKLACEYIKYGYTCAPPVVTPLLISTSKSKGEDECRTVLENYFGKPFKSTRSLSFLRNPETGRNLELDGYNEELGIAFEFNGKQHYQWPNHTGQTEAEFIQQKRRDIFKREQCDKHGIFLITVPYHIKDIHTFITDSLNA